MIGLPKTTSYGSTSDQGAKEGTIPINCRWKQTRDAIGQLDGELSGYFAIAFAELGAAPTNTVGSLPDCPAQR
jgi:hypothetical protein